MHIGHSPCIWHTELGCIAFPRIIRLQMISSRDVYKIVGGAKLHRQTGLGSSYMQSIPTDLLEHSSDATGAAEVVAGVSGIPALHHLQLVYVCFRVWVPDSASVLQNWPEGTSVVGLLGCLVDVLRPCTVLVESHSKVLCGVSHLQYLWMLYLAMIGDGFRVIRSS